MNAFESAALARPKRDHPDAALQRWSRSESKSPTTAADLRARLEPPTRRRRPPTQLGVLLGAVARCAAWGIDLWPLG